MELVLEIFFELFIGGFADLSGNPRVPRFVRIILMLIIALPVMIFMAILTVTAIPKLNYAVIVICSLVFVLMLVLSIAFICKILKTPTKKSKRQSILSTLEANQQAEPQQSEPQQAEPQQTGTE